MKTRESGMPDEDTWNRFFDPDKVLDQLGLTTVTGNAAEFGCGYGTFTVPAARRTSGTLYAFDIEPEMINRTASRSHTSSLQNVETQLRDLVDTGTGLSSESVQCVLLFNLLHAEERMQLLEEAWRILCPSGRLGVIHWNYDPTTPRGPSMAIRPRPDDCRRWAEQAGFQTVQPGPVDLPPFHYGFLFSKR